MKHEHVNHLNNTNGFTLLEMLVVVVIVGVLGSIAAPGWLSFVQRQRMTSVSSDLLGALRTAQSEAISKQENREVIFSSTNLSLNIRPSAASTGGIITELGSDDPRNRVSLDASTSVIFDHDGAVNVDTPFVVNITHDGVAEKRCVIITTLLGGLKSESNDTCDTFAAIP